MRAGTGLVLLVSLGMLTVACGREVQRGRQGSVRLQPSSLEAGDVLQGETATLPFELVNNAPDAVLIAQIETSCACGQVELPQREVPAGGLVQGIVRYLVKRVGRQSERIRFFVAGSSPVELTVSAVGRPALSVEPPSLSILFEPEEDSRVVSFLVHCMTLDQEAAKELAPTTVDCSSVLAEEVGRTRAPAAPLRLSGRDIAWGHTDEVRVRLRRPPDGIADTVRLVFSSPQVGVRPVSVGLDCKRLFDVSPRRLLLDLGSPEVLGVIRIASVQADQDVLPPRIEVHPRELLQAELVSTSPRRWRLDVRPTQAGRSHGEFRGVARLFPPRAGEGGEIVVPIEVAGTPLDQR